MKNNHPNRDWRTRWRIQPKEIPEDYAWPEAIKQYREERKLTQEELAERLNVAPVTVRKWERGEYVPPPYLLLALSALA